MVSTKIERELLWLVLSNGNTDRMTSYINTAHGDENNKVIYAENSERLRRLKRRYDPQGRFDNFFPIQLLRSSSIEL